MLDDPRGLAALVLAAGVALATIALAIGAAVNGGNPTVTVAVLLAAVLGGAVGALATFLGARQDRSGGPPSPPSRPPA
jgi:hypothetical protein